MTAPVVGPSIASILDRLKANAQRAGRPVAEIHEFYALERFLHRLARSQHCDRFVLKGALSLRHWLGSDTRPTRDVDLLGPAGLDAVGIRLALRDVVSTEVEFDGIEFDLESIVANPIRLESAVLGYRSKFDATIGRTRLRYQIDVGLGDDAYPDPVAVVPSSILGMPVASIRVYTPYTTVAEKLEAIVYHGASNSRMKDYHDLWQLATRLSFDGETLSESVRRVFGRRNTPIPQCPMTGLDDAYVSQPVTQVQWTAFLRKSQLEEPAAGLAGVVTEIRAFVEPALDAARDVGRLDGAWAEGGPWCAPVGTTGHDVADV